MGRAATVIQAATRVSGRIEGKGDLDVFGAVQGAIVIDGDLLVDGDARVDADVQAARVEIHGVFTGNVQAERIELLESAIVVGDLRAATVIVAEGARFRGLIDMGEFDSAEAPPPKSRGARAKPASRSSRSAKPAKPAKSGKGKKPKAEPADEIPEDDDA